MKFVHIAARCAVALCATIAPSQAQPNSMDRLRNYLQTILEKGSDIRYTAASVQLGPSNGKTILVLISGNEYCGSGGCTMYVLADHDTNYSIITQTTITREPIYVLRHTTLGWHDIAVTVGGGGIRYGLAVLQFDGRKYQDNPTVAPAHALSGKPDGTIAINTNPPMLPVF